MNPLPKYYAWFGTAATRAIALTYPGVYRDPCPCCLGTYSRGPTIDEIARGELPPLGLAEYFLRPQGVAHFRALCPRHWRRLPKQARAQYARK